jgi:hypothetical protein
LQELVDAGSHSVHRETCVRLNDSQTYRARGDVRVAAVFDETEDALVVGQPSHTAARSARDARTSH